MTESSFAVSPLAAFFGALALTRETNGECEWEKGGSPDNHANQRALIDSIQHAQSKGLTSVLNALPRNFIRVMGTWNGETLSKAISGMPHAVSLGLNGTNVAMGVVTNFVLQGSSQSLGGKYAGVVLDTAVVLEHPEHKHPLVRAKVKTEGGAQFELFAGQFPDLEGAQLIERVTHISRTARTGRNVITVLPQFSLSVKSSDSSLNGLRLEHKPEGEPTSRTRVLTDGIFQQISISLKCDSAQEASLHSADVVSFDTDSVVWLRVMNFEGHELKEFAGQPLVIARLTKDCCTKVSALKLGAV